MIYKVLTSIKNQGAVGVGGLKCSKRQSAHELTKLAKCARRRDRCRKLLRRYYPVSLVIDSDELIFTVAAPRHTQNDRV